MFHFAQVTALFLSAVLVVTVESLALPANCDRQYVVRLGDVCDAISAAQNVSTYQLATANAGIINSDCSNLSEGETLCLGIQGQDCNQVSVVQSGDSCPGIASAAGISVATLLSNNPNIASDCTNIYPGEVLCVAPSS
ncbi:hypothetical protein BDQ17DRAFT_1310833 [Cyathus striatus]|nr:hypothetical protein BDQ17DRAFT_1310823 [Cyathus striatus]KAF8995664.1 hypothetical protein BDQ17DRAFT_1310833 [Cyathus striatus]